MTNCECGDAVFIKKSGECRRCYMRRWRSENPDRVKSYETSAEGKERIRTKARERYHAAAAARREACRDTRPVQQVILDHTERAFANRERYLEKRREWNARHAEERKRYRETYADPNKRDRQRRYADEREKRTGRRSEEWARTPEQQARKTEYNRRWREENLAHARSSNAARQRRYRSERSGA